MYERKLPVFKIIDCTICKSKNRIHKICVRDISSGKKRVRACNCCRSFFDELVDNLCFDCSNECSIPCHPLFPIGNKQ